MLEEYLGKFKGRCSPSPTTVIFWTRWWTASSRSRRAGRNFTRQYSFYAVEKERRYEEKLKQYEKEQAKIEQLEKAAEQMRVWAYSGMDKTFKRVKSMEKRIERMRVTDRPKRSGRWRSASESGSSAGTRC